MELIHIVVLALVQGFTEFLPISSSGHLVLLPILTGWDDQGLAYDVAAHIGTLLAVMIYYRRDIQLMTRAWIANALGGPATVESTMAWFIIGATIPVGIAGVLLHELAETAFRSPLVIAGTTIVFGLLLWYADAIGKRERDETQLRFRDAAFIGVAQVLALVPGTSRSGITITAGLMLGLTRQAAARFSFLLAIPVILAAGGLETVGLIKAGGPADWTGLFLVALLSAASAFVCIAIFLRLLDRIGMLPFALYRLALGAVLLYFFV